MTRDMAAYAQIVIQQSHKHPGRVWLAYDQFFRQQRTAGINIPWNDLASSIMAATVLRSGDCCSLCHSPDHTTEQIIWQSTPNARAPLRASRRRLLKKQFITGVRQALSAAGLDPSHQSGHSFRIGAATMAAAAGIPNHLIKTLGRWESSAYLLYVRTPRESLAAVSARLALHNQATPPLQRPSADQPSNQCLGLEL